MRCGYVASSVGDCVATLLLDRLRTVLQALYHPTRLALVEPPSKLAEDSMEWVFVYGGSRAPRCCSLLGTA